MRTGWLMLMLMPALAAAPRPAPTADGPALAAAKPETPEPAAPTTDPLDALVADSPFGSPAGAGGRTGAPGATGPLELRSIVFVDGAYQFSVFDQGTNKAEWVRIGEKGLPFVARSFNRERDSLTVEHQGRTLVLALQPARTLTSATNGSVPPTPPALPGRNGPGAAPVPAANANDAVPGPTGAPGPGNVAPAPNTANAAEAQRLQNLADEIRRRRGAGPQLVLPKKN